MLKTIFTVALSIFSVTIGLSQSAISAGTASLGGSIGYNQSGSKSSNTFNGQTFSQELRYSQFRVAPAAGYFVADNLAIGLVLNYSAQKVSSKSSPSQGPTRPDLASSHSFDVGPFVQYYKMLGDQFGLVGSLGTGYSRGISYQYIDSSSDSYKIKSQGFYANITPGIIFFPVPKFGISASLGSLGYSYFSNKFPEGPRLTGPDEYENSSSNFGASFGLSQLQFGGTYYFGR